MANYWLAVSGNDNNNGSEIQPWRTLTAACQRAKPGDTVTLEDGRWLEQLRPANSGTASAKIRFRARNPGKVLLYGAVPYPASATKDAKGTWSTPWTAAPAFGAWQETFETVGKHASLFDKDYNQYGSNPTLDIDPNSPSQFKLKGGRLYVRTIDGKSPVDHKVRVAVLEAAINLNDRSHVTVEGINAEGFKHFIATGRGAGLRIANCQGRCFGGTAVYLSGIRESEVVGLLVQGAGSWLGHYNDCIQLEAGASGVLLDGVDVSYGGHSGIISLDADGTKLRNAYLHDMGGSLLTLKQGSDALEAVDCWFTGAADVAHVDWHKVDHAAIQLGGKGHRFTNCMFTANGKSVLGSSDGTQVCQDILFDRCTLERTANNGLELQQGGPLGSIARLIFRQCAIRNAATGDLLSLWLTGANNDMQGLRFDRCQITGGQIRGTNGTFATVDQAKVAMPTVYDASQQSIAGAGSSLTAPPTTGGPTPPDPPNPPDPPPVTGKPVLRTLKPASGPPGTKVTAMGNGFGNNPAVIYSNKDGGVRLENLGGNDTSVSWTMPADVVTGQVTVRRIDVSPTQLSNPLTFTVTGPPANQPPVANAGGPYRGVVGKSMRFVSQSKDPDGTITSWDWQFGDGKTGKGEGTNYWYEAPGTYTVTLTVTDDRGATATATTTATITAAPQPGGNLEVTATLLPSGTFTGQVKGRSPLPAGSLITIVATTPDGWAGNGSAVVAGDAPPPPPPPPPPPDDLPAEVAECVRLHNLIRSGAGLPGLAVRALAMPEEEGEIGEPWRQETPRRSFLAEAAAALGPLAVDERLMKAARLHAQDMAAFNYFSHTGRDGSTPFARMQAAGFDGGMMGENLAKGFSHAESVMRAWMNSPGHAANILHAGYRWIGIGFVAGPGVWVVDFGG